MPLQTFISYSHDSAPHKQRVARLADCVRAIDGIACVFDGDVAIQGPEARWTRWSAEQIKRADYVIVVCTQLYYAHFSGTTSGEAHGRGSDWEAGIIETEIYRSRSRTKKFIPVYFDPRDAGFIPEALQGYNCYDLSTAGGFEALVAHILHEPEAAPTTFPKHLASYARSDPPRARWRCSGRGAAVGTAAVAALVVASLAAMFFERQWLDAEIVPVSVPARQDGPSEVVDPVISPNPEIVTVVRKEPRPSADAESAPGCLDRATEWPGPLDETRSVVARGAGGVRFFVSLVQCAEGELELYLCTPDEIPAGSFLELGGSVKLSDETGSRVLADGPSTMPVEPNRAVRIWLKGRRIVRGLRFGTLQGSIPVIVPGRAPLDLRIRSLSPNGRCGG